MGAKYQQFNLKKLTRASRWYWFYITALGSFLIAFAAASTFAPVHNSDAQEVNMEVSEETGWYVQVSNAETVSLGEVRTTSTGQLASAKDTINVETNSPFGYKLLFSASTANLVNESSSSSYLSPASGTLDAPQVLTKDTWGFSLSAQDTPIPSTNSTWSAVPTIPTQIASLDTSNLPSGTDTDIYYGVNASTALLSGTYSTTITYTAFSEGVNEDLPTMQDFTQAKCDALTTDVATRLVDTRDLKVYNVTKMKDGNCWMTSNLALDGGRTLTPADSDVVTNHELPENISDSTTPEYDVAQIYSGNAENTDEYGTKYGNLYNWNAATATVGKQATTGAVFESICPKGWMLPQQSGNGYANLLKEYGLSYTSDGAEEIAEVQKAPLYFPAAGNMNEGTGTFNPGSGHYWTRSVYTSSQAFQFMFSSSNGHFYPTQSAASKKRGESVRCVLGE